MPNPDLTDITVVLDRSGSMQSIAVETISGFNAFLKEQQDTPGAALFSLVQFDHEYLPVHRGVPVADVSPLTAETFVPRGYTHLLDAMGRTIDEAGARFSAMAEADRPGKVVVVILTDGEENRSHLYGRDKVMEMVNHQTEAYGWTFLYLGANQDAIAVGGGMGILAANSMSYLASNADVVMRSTSAKLAAFKGGLVTACSYDDDDRAEALAPKS